MRKLYELIKIALEAIWSNKVRSFLTTLGIIIGVFAVVMLMAIVMGVRSQISKEIERLGSNTLIVLPGKSAKGIPTPIGIAGTSTLTLSDARAIKDKSKYAKFVAPATFEPAEVSANKKRTTVLLFGAGVDYRHIRNQKINRGRSFTQKEVDKEEKVAVIGSDVVKNLFNKENPVGRKITLENTSFKVIGSYKSSGVVEVGINFNNAVYIPVTTILQLTKSSTINRILIKTKSSKNTDAAAKEIKKIILKEHKEVENFSVLTQKDFLGLFETATNLLTLLLTGVASISLLVGGIGIMNIMLVSVIERTSEIGLRKAVGATSLDILFQFLIEAVTLSIFGALLGLVIARTAAYLISQQTALPVSVSPFTILLAFGFASAIGVIFGTAPAVRAARLDPIVALRHE